MLFQDPAGFYEFPSPSSPGFRPPRFNMFPDDLEDNFRNNSFEQPAEANTRHPANPETDKPIPIRVVHERTSGTPPKNRLNSNSSRNTTEIPARTNNLESPNNISAEKSPRLERAHSEPPKLFNQRLRAAGASSPQQPPTYSTIPENSEPIPVGSRSPRFSTAPEPKSTTPNHKLSSSASAPSVPASNTPPTAPPRRNKLDRDEDKPNQQQPPQQQQQNASQSEAPKIRHIPIFVEGRDEPVSHRKISGGDSNFRQPSEFYPPNVQKVRSQSVSSPGVGAGSGFGRGLNLKPHQQQQQQRPLEPTSPLSPPPSDQPIPMGCSNYFVNSAEAPKPEPSSPAPPPPGPIPMPFCPSDVVDAPPVAPEVHTIPVKIVETPEPAKQEPPKTEQNDPKNLTPAEAKMRKIEAEVEELLQRVEKFAGGKKDKEYLYLDDLLTQKLCILDGIESDGREDIRKMRKDSIKTITRCLSMLDRRATPVTSLAAASDDAEVSNKVLSDLANLDCQDKNKEDEKEKISDQGPKKNNK